jgi:hypothetical protein
MEKLKLAADWAKAHKTIILYAVGIILVAVLAVVAWRYVHRPEPVTTETQVQAQTVQGVDRAANNAHITLTPDQSQQTADRIKYIYTHDVQPVYTITTTGANAEKQAQAAQKAAGADFSIVTNKSAPDTKTDLKTLPASSTVELNQYNVQAYKKVLHTVEVSPDIDCTGIKGVGEVGYTVSRKVSDSGQYVGVGASYNVENHKAMLKVSYTW